RAALVALHARDRGRDVLRRRRVADQRGQALPGRERPGDDPRAAGQHDLGTHRGRRPGRRAAAARRRHRRRGQPGRRRRRHLLPDQPARRADDHRGEPPVRILICEDSVLLREGIVRLVADAGHEVVAALPDAGRLDEEVAATSPDLAILDVRLPPTFTDEGIRAALRLRAAHPDLAVLVLSQYVEERYATELIAANTGGLGYLLKDRVADVEEFLGSIETVGSGGTVLDPEVVAQLLTR